MMVQLLFIDMNTLKGKLKMQKTINKPQSVTIDLVCTGESESSRRNTIQASSGGWSKCKVKVQEKTPTWRGGKKFDASPSTKNLVEKSSKQ